MRFTLLLISFIFLQSCCTLKQKILLSEDYALATLTLNQFPKWNEYRLMREPSTHISDGYLKGFITLDLKKFRQRFNYRSSNTKKWKKHLFDDKKISEKLLIIKNRESIPDETEEDRNKTYMKMSRPIYSEDGKYAVVIVDLFAKDSLWHGEGHAFVYKKIDGEWKLHLKFIPYYA